MISVLILDGFADSSLCKDNESASAVNDVYIPLLVGILRYNGFLCKVISLNNFGRTYSILGVDRESVIYVPKFSCSEKDESAVSFIYTDSVSSASVAFSIASKLRSIRENMTEGIVFINLIKEYDSLKKYSPVIVDDMRFLNTMAICDMTENVYKTALSVVMALCRHYGVIFRDPSCE